MRAIVVFKSGDHPLSFLLKKGFQHCFVCVEHNKLWLQIDYGSGMPEIRYLSESSFDLTSYFKDQGMTVVKAVQREKSVTIPLVIRNCVGTVKQILCINSLALTPYALYKYLVKNQG